jgi:hypothetical protein
VGISGRREETFVDVGNSDQMYTVCSRVFPIIYET